MNQKEKRAIAALSRSVIEVKVATLSDAHKNLSRVQGELEFMTAAMDGEIAEIRKKYADQISAHSIAIEAGSSMAAKLASEVEVWAEAHRDDAFDGKKKSIEFLTAVIGFRNLKPAVDTLKNWTQPKAALALLRRKWGKAYVEVKYSLKKNDLIKDREKLGSKLTTCGLVIEEAEEFFIDHKTETRDAAPGAA